MFEDQASLLVIPANLLSINILGPDSIPLGQVASFNVMATYTNGTVLDVTENVLWTVDKPDNGILLFKKGDFKGLQKGPYNLKVDLQGTSTNKTVTVTDPQIVSVKIENTLREIPLSFKNKYSFLVTLSDGSVIKDYCSNASHDCSSVQWESSHRGLADFNDPG
ncbi:MAG TPA: hypothetical protein DCY70_16140, partial [Shewanella sp.]|nr:hypothetical protein [Shewanella sp.]